MSEAIQTPFFLIREELLGQNISGFQQALNELWPNSTIAYSVKTNALPWILDWMNHHGVFAEVVSDEEYQLAELSGYLRNKIVFNGPVKTDAFLLKAIAGGSLINIDSSHELECIKREKPELKGPIGIRVNVDPSYFSDEDVGFHEDGFRFGFSEENGELENAIAVLRSIYGDIPIGLHMHVNSITRSADVYRTIAEYGARIVQEYKLIPSYVDIGGGFFGGVPGKTTPHEYIGVIKAALENAVDTKKTRLIIEPGSAAIGSAIELHTSVVDVKDTAGARIVTTDGSRIHIDPLWLKQHYLFTTDATKPNHPRQVICGYTCMDRDRLMVLEDQPELSVGDHIVYHRVGNYTVTFGGPFIRPYPPVYVQSEKDICLIRKQMTMEEYYRMETVK